ncbi:uncharacterized protein LOC130705841 [Balaenoptera acutorostrata]|uniref:Uncharacterized protein LOC130705840 n=1 Tax=Balaenoptera acutorostrata TaxID=9767 RepID=A0ABM3SMW7_BALAC|nr:uncharacterized protein LOC130705840 [Balaenoptera acutorostrata]XP_057391187.1 uncharacterized protein LOC130705840 [Balaenoptera acutorostrata]XP_057391189.1 uncharacterized protein LOC130705841 [Balaenoptera acutorostrata]XP_057391190.1 uncharacterized protein LOC130705841 [Balaenoptera acutorostrata]
MGMSYGGRAHVTRPPTRIRLEPSPARKCLSLTCRSQTSDHEAAAVTITRYAKGRGISARAGTAKDSAHFPAGGARRKVTGTSSNGESASTNTAVVPTATSAVGATWRDKKQLRDPPHIPTKNTRTSLPLHTLLVPKGGAPFLEVLQYQVDARSGRSKLLFQLPAPKIHLIYCPRIEDVSDIKLIRTDTTLDLSQKAEKRYHLSASGRCRPPFIPIQATVSALILTPRLTSFASSTVLSLETCADFLFSTFVRRNSVYLIVPSFPRRTAISNLHAPPSVARGRAATAGGLHPPPPDRLLAPGTQAGPGARLLASWPVHVLPQTRDRGGSRRMRGER